MNKIKLTLSLFVMGFTMIGFTNCAGISSEWSALSQSESVEGFSSSSSYEVEGDAKVNLVDPELKLTEEVVYLGTDFKLLLDTDSDGYADKEVDAELFAEEVKYLAMTYDNYERQPTDSADAYYDIKPAISLIEDYKLKQELIGKPGESCVEYLDRLNIKSSGTHSRMGKVSGDVQIIENRCAQLVFNDLTNTYNCSTAGENYVSPFFGKDKDGIERRDLFVPLCKRADGELVETAISAGSWVPER